MLGIKILKSTLHQALKDRTLQRAVLSIKPHLTPQNKAQTVTYCCSFVEDNNYFDGNMMDRVDIDEKWFYVRNNVPSILWSPAR